MVAQKFPRRVLVSVTALAAIVSALIASTAGADIVTVGSPLPGGLVSSYTSNGSVATVANVAIAEPGAHVTSPVNGTIVQWRVRSTGPGTFAIRVLRPNGSGGYNGAGTSSQVVPDFGDYTFSASLPIQAGDLLGLDIPNSGTNGIGGITEIPGSEFVSWIPPVADGSPSGFADPFFQTELAFNADVQYAPAAPAQPTPRKKCKKKKS